jgi:hypothetical protein
MSRAHVIALGLVAALLVSNGGPSLDGSRGAAADVSASGNGGIGEAHIAAYLRDLNPDSSAAERERIAAAVMRYSAKYALDPALVLAVIVQESSGRSWVRSPKGAIGLMQVMPYMMGSLPVAGNPTHVESNIEAGCLILADNIRRLGEARGILAYFWGNDIRGVGYLENVQAARAAIRRHAAQS